MTTRKVPVIHACSSTARNRWWVPSGVRSLSCGFSLGTGSPYERSYLYDRPLGSRSLSCTAVQQSRDYAAVCRFTLTGRSVRGDCGNSSRLNRRCYPTFGGSRNRGVTHSTGPRSSRSSRKFPRSFSRKTARRRSRLPTVPAFPVGSRESIRQTRSSAAFVVAQRRSQYTPTPRENARIAGNE